MHASPEFARNRDRKLFFGRKIRKMHARPEVKRILIEKRMKRWWSIARCPLIDLNCKPARARRNLLRLLARYPEVGQSLGFSVVGAYR
jgi:hypothetical protein